MSRKFRYAFILCCGLGFQAEAATTPVPSDNASFQVEEVTIAGLQQAILARQTTVTEIVQRYLARIAAYNGPAVIEPDGPLGAIQTVAHAQGINALSTLNLRPAARRAWGFDDHKARSLTDPVDGNPAMPDALETAARLDEEFARTGKLVGPLHGVVFAIKDHYDTFDMRSTSGADAFYENDRPPGDATVVARLRAAGAVILAKSNLSEYASALPRSSFGGTFANPYDTERTPGISSSGSGSSVAANLVTCAIGSEATSSIRGPAAFNSLVGLSPTQQLVSRQGMIQMLSSARVGPITRTVEDAARVLTVIAGYDAADSLTAFSVDRMPDRPYEAYTHDQSLAGVRIGVVREYMDRKLFSVADAESIALADRAIAQLKALGATVVDPGEGGELFTRYIRQLAPELLNGWYTNEYPERLAGLAGAAATDDQLAALVDLAFDWETMPGAFTLRDLGANPRMGGGETGEGRYKMNVYLRRRGDANIRTMEDLSTKAVFFEDPLFSNWKERLVNINKARVYDTTVPTHTKAAVQQIILQAFAAMKLDAVVYPTNTLPPRKLEAPGEPALNGRTGIWTFLGRQGFPVATVPAGFSTRVYDRIRDPQAPAPPPGWVRGARGNPPEPTILTGPVAARLPVGLDILGRPFSEPILLRIAAAYESATHHREPPPDFGPLPRSQP